MTTVLTLRQYADKLRREYAAENGISLAEMRRAQPDACYISQHIQYVQEIARSGAPFASRQLDHYYRAYGGQALSVLIRFHPSILPLYYVHPDARRRGGQEALC